MYWLIYRWPVDIDCSSLYHRVRHSISFKIKKCTWLLLIQNSSYSVLVFTFEFNAPAYHSVEIHPHPGYNISDYSTLVDDIGLIKLNKPINATPNGLLTKENNICLPPKSAVSTPEEVVEYAVTAGWGQIYNGSLQTGYLKIDFKSREYGGAHGEPIIETKKLDNQMTCKVSIVSYFERSIHVKCSGRFWRTNLAILPWSCSCDRCMVGSNVR